MASANKVFVSPGVYTSERDLSFVSQSVGVTTLGLVGETLKGPAFEPIFVTSYDEFTSYFGGTNPEKFVNTQIPKYESAYIAKSYLQQSNQLFVTRVLGLSGYDAGPSWSVTSVANVDCSTVGVDGDSNWVTLTNISVGFTFQVNGGTASTIEFFDIETELASYPYLLSKFDNPFLKYDGTSSTIRSEIQNFLWNTFYSQMSDTTLPSGLYDENVIYFGALPTTQYNIYNGYTGKTNVFGINDFNASTIDYCDGLNDSWFYSNFDPIPNTDNYSGFSFIVTQNNQNFSSFGGYNAANYNALTIGIQLFTGITYTEYHNLVLATLRSRGITNYSSSQHGPKYQVTGTTDVSLTVTGAYSAATTNPYSTFSISGTQYDSSAFSFEASFESANANYINKVFGQDNFEKDRTVVPLFVEESYDTLLTWGYNKGYIRGLNTTLTDLNSAESQSATSLGNYLERYQTPTTPYVVSELRGTKVYNLFRFISISDGTAANTEIKVSIQNMSFNNLTFDVVIRDFYDTDANPVVLEKFTNCTMNPDLNSYIAKRIGTSDGDFAINSRYVMLEINYEAPYDALPCGFNGYITRTYDVTSANIHPPFPVYKTSYEYPGEVIWNPPFGTSVGVDNKVISTGDNVRRTYLGFSTKLGYDSDFLQYKGKQNLITGFDSCTLDEADFSSWNYLTKGFHMDSGATVITIASNYLTSGETAFDVGAGSFTSEPTLKTETYYYLYSRKFSMAFYGGFDGWDIYREYRTNNDDFTLGGTGYLAGAAPCTPYTNATGWGSFRRITVDQNATDYANTDYYAYLLGIQTFSNPEVTNINVLVTPGIDYVNNYELVNATINMVEYNRADSIYITTTPDFDLLQNSTVISDNLILPEEAVVNLEDSAIDSNYTATYYPWVLTRDTVNNTQLYIPPTAEVTRNLALTDNVAFPWFATAGYTRGIVNAVRARKRLTQEDRDILYKGRINPIATFNDVGTVIWGNKTLQIRESALDRINVRRLLLQARKLISAVAIRLLFEQNDSLVRQQFLDSVNPILDAIRRDRGLYDFRVTVSNTPEDLDANQLVGKIYIKPTKALEFIDIEFLITPTGASFENI
jgi:hypothetical protein